MKLIHLLLGSAALATIMYTLYIQQNAQQDDLSALPAFLKFKKNYNKSYSSPQEHLYRYQVFLANLNNIREWEKTKPFKVSVNQFSDLTWEEFKSAYLMKSIPNTLNRNSETAEEVDIDWRKEKVVTPVKNQAMCGSCWAFSTTGSMEAFLAQKSGKLVSLSEQQLVDCSSDQGNMGCNGGLMTSAYDYIAQNGLETEQDYPYKGRDMICKADPKKSTNIVSKYQILDQADVTQLTEFLKKGPVSVALEVQYDFQAYSGGVYRSEDPECGSGLNHGVLLVGQKKNYYIVKNSWGGDWGEEGFIRMEIGVGSGTCGIANNWDVLPTE